MSVLTQVIRRKQVWGRLCEIADQRRRQRATFDWVFYMVLISLAYVYRNEIVTCLSNYLGNLF